MEPDPASPDTPVGREPEFPPMVGDRLLTAVAIPDHELLRCIGWGSYGQVWLGRNMMGVYRAIKIVYRKAFASQRPFDRELSGIRKFEPLSRSHEGFVDVLHVGINQEQGYFYYVMELGDDQASAQNINPENYRPNTLASEISRRGKLSLRECLQLGVALTQALAELHKHGLVHRDIKPSNIIFVNSVPKLADIGLVADVNEARSYVGTEGFIPPEGPGTPQADLYSLGKVMYEASTGKDRQDFPEMPTQWSQSEEYAGLLELNEIILMACKQQPARRYPSAWDMHADLLVVVNGKSVKRLRVLEKRMAAMKRVAGILALVLAVAGLALYQVYRGWKTSLEARQRLVSANLSHGNQAMESGDLLGALPFFCEALRLDQDNLENLRTHRLRIGSILAQCPKLTRIWLASKRVNEAQVSPDGKTVVFAEYYGQAELHDLRSGELLLHRFGPESGLVSIAFSPDGQRIVTASQDMSVILWQTSTLAEIMRLPHARVVLSARFSPDGHRLVTACVDRVARVWNTDTGALELELKGHTDALTYADFSPDGRWIVTTSRDFTARLWGALDGKAAGPVLAHPGWVAYAAFTPDCQRLVTACHDHKARVWELETGRRVFPDLDHGDVIRSVVLSPDGQLILTASFDGTARLWRADDLQPLGSNPILRHGERVMHGSFSADGRLIATSDSGGYVRIWDLAGAGMPPQPEQRAYCRDASHYLTLTNGGLQVWDALTDHASAPLIKLAMGARQFDLSRDGLYAFGFQDGASFSNATGVGTNTLVQVWAVQDSRMLGPEIVLSNRPAGAALSEDGRRIAIWRDREAQVFDVGTGQPRSPSLSHPEKIDRLLFNPRGDRIVSTGGTKVLVWDGTNPSPVFPEFDHPVGIVYADFSRNGRYLVVCPADAGLTKCSAQVWDMTTGRRVGEPLRHGDGVLSAAFSQDARLVATGSEDFSARIWTTSTGLPIGLPLKHESQVAGVTLSSDSKWIATATRVGLARVWDVETSDLLTPPFRNSSRLTSAWFLPGNKRLVSAYLDGRASVWDLPVADLPIGDLGAISAVLSGGLQSPNAAQSNGGSESIDKSWRTLRERYPATFSTSTNEVVAWHQFQAEENTAAKRWAEAAFHLTRLAALRPEDQSVASQLAEAKRHLGTGN